MGVFGHFSALFLGRGGVPPPGGGPEGGVPPLGGGLGVFWRFLKLLIGNCEKTLYILAELGFFGLFWTFWTFFGFLGVIYPERIRYRGPFQENPGQSRRAEKDFLLFFDFFNSDWLRLGCI